ncbi:hypothetical protein AWY96_05120 [Serratia plymuthica]|uniref:hypothetical protein n=1 Tax=Serratia plymuthica TaxID=82996 RepID=UPI0007A08FAA|nr:hypothetical protein [Serratia plymuthica]KYQ97914.1 hypothetical protein AWY96_05120 [Serratia plymuthica]
MAENVITESDLIDELYDLADRISTFNEEWDVVSKNIIQFVEKKSNGDGTLGLSEIEITNKEDTKISLTLLKTFNFTIEKAVRGKSFSILVYELLGNDVDGKEIKKEVSSYKHMYSEGWGNGAKLFSKSPLGARAFAVNILYKLIEHVNK